MAMTILSPLHGFSPSSITAVISQKHSFTKSSASNHITSLGDPPAVHFLLGDEFLTSFQKDAWLLGNKNPSCGYI